MSLRVWLPLDEDLNNLGVSDIEVVNNGATINSEGKLGKCYSCNFTIPSSSTINNLITYLDSGSDFSVAFWFKYTNANIGEFIQCGDSSATGSRLHFAINNNVLRFGFRANDYDGPTLATNIWYHVVCSYSNSKKYIYLNGNLHGTANSNKLAIPQNSAILFISSSVYLNDFRIYDHCLSAAEVHEISLGMLAHYKMDQNLTPLENVFSYPTFNTNDDNGGWSHWGREGAIGTYGQNTDKKYIYNKNNQYSHWVENTGTAAYWTYHSFKYDSAKSLQCIVKEENSAPIIDETIVFPAWNGSNGVARSGKWTSITDLGDGFYLCKVENLGQNDTTNNPIGIYLNAGYKVYISEMYLENRSYAADLWQQSNLDILEDSSGYNRHATLKEGNWLVSTNTLHNILATNWNGETTAQTSTIFEDTVLNNELTWMCWVKKGWNDAAIRTIYYGIVQTYIYSDNIIRIHWHHATKTKMANNAWSTSQIIPTNKWTHIAFTFKDGALNVYINGKYKRSSHREDTGQFIQGQINTFLGKGSTIFSDNSDNFIGDLSDMRIYSTALSDEDIAKIYNTTLKIDNKNKIHSFNFIENNNNKITKSGLLQGSNFFEGNGLSYLKYDPNIYIEPDGSCWVRIYHHNNPGAGSFSIDDDFAHSVYIDENRWFNVEICSWVNKWELMMKIQYIENGIKRKVRWIQNINPMTAEYDDVGVNNVTQIINDEYDASPLYGLYHPTVNDPKNYTYLAANNGHSGQWWGAVGAYIIYQNDGIPGWITEVDGKIRTTTGYNDLYLRIDNLTLEELTNAKNTKNNIWLSSNFIEM